MALPFAVRIVRDLLRQFERKRGLVGFQKF